MADPCKMSSNLIDELPKDLVMLETLEFVLKVGTCTCHHTGDFPPEKTRD
jgi:hypothetical protein